MAAEHRPEAAGTLPAAGAHVWVVIIEWNDPPSEVTGDPGLVGVYATEAGAKAAQLSEQQRFDSEGSNVDGFTMRDGRYCSVCGEDTGDPTHTHDHGPDAEAEFCDCCGAELTAVGSCDNDHDEWDVDIHVRETEVLP